MAKENEIDIKLNIDTSALSDLDNLASDVPDEINIDVNADTTGVDVSDITDLDGEVISPELDTTESKEGKEVREGINFLATMKKIEIAINIAGTVLDFVKDIGALTVAPFLDVEDAVARINAQTGGTGVADLGQLIRDLQAADLGDSVDQIGDVVIAAQQLGAPIEEAATAALTFTHTFKDEDPTTVLTTLNTLVETGLVPNLQDAADLMTVAFQQGVDKGGDALAIVNANATSWADMGLNGTQALSAINSLMDNGVDNASNAAKMVQTLDDALTTAAENADSPQAEMLKTLGIENPKDSGQAMGADFIDGFAAAFSALPSDQQDLASGLLFGKGGKKFTGALEGLTTEGGPFGDIVGAAADAATEIDNSLRGAIADFVTEINAQIATLLSSDEIDLPGKIAAIKEALQRGVAVLSDGGTVGKSLEVALNIPGLEDTLNTFVGNFERIMGNLEIIFLQVVASIQDITGHGKEAAATRETIASKSKTQLAFDLQLANADELPAMVSQALSRGLSTEDITNALETSVNESIAKADFDQGATIIQGAIAGAIADGATPEAANHLAFNYVDKLKDGFDNALSAGNINLLQDMIAIEPNAAVPGLDTAVADMKKQLADAFAPKPGEANAVNPFTSVFAGINTSFTDAFPGMAGGKSGATGGGMLGSLTDSMKDVVTDVTNTDNVFGVAMDHIQTATDTVATSATTNMGTVSTAFDTAAASAALMDQGITLSFTDNTVTASFDAVAASAGVNFPIVLNWFGQTSAGAAQMDAIASGHIQHMLGQLHDLQFLSAQVAAGVQAALNLGGNLPGAGAAAAGDTTLTVNQTNNNTNGAQTDANTFQIAAALRGA